jgi:uncharacterized protein YbaR (Trm112 family)
VDSELRISQSAQNLLRCPVCHSRLTLARCCCECTNCECGSCYPIVDGIPVLLDEGSSVFSIDDYAAHRETFFSNTVEDGLTKIARGLVPSISRNVRGRQNYSRLIDLLEQIGPSRPGPTRVLVLGGSVLGQGMESIASQHAFDLVESDVSLGPRTMLICDAHDIPFEDGSFDGVIVQAVLEHVVDPFRCVAEIHRVLDTQGLVYAETPFMQQVHGGPYDFMRFTHLGHRRLFRMFEEIDSGAVCGPGMALAWSYQYFLMSFSARRIPRALARGVARFTCFLLKYVDDYLIDKPGAIDAASGFYFLGRKAEQALPDRDLVKLYKGAG